MNTGKNLFTLLLLVGLPLIFQAGLQAGQVQRQPYNVVLIAVDDLNDWVGSMGGHPNAITPNIDRLVSQGTLFEHAYPAAPLCNPSRTAVFTGLRPSTSGIYCNHGWFRDKPELAEWVTLPQYFEQHGYATYGGGKLFHHAKGKMSDPVSWQSYYQDRVGTPNPPEDQRYRHGLRGAFDDASWYFNKALDWAPRDIPKEETADWQTADRAAKIINEKHDQPFFVGVGIFRPHLTWYATREFFDMHPLDGIELPPHMENDLTDVPPVGRRLARHDFPIIREAGKWKEGVRAYLACGSFADACVGHVLQAVEGGPNKDNTVVVLWGDHGWNLGEKDHWAKYALWEDTTRTPFVVYVPGNAPARVGRAVSLVDIYRTLVDLCDLPEKGDIEGFSLVPFLEDPSTASRNPVVTTHWKDNHAVADGRYRYIHYRDGGEEFYDHAVDPNEWINRANDPGYAEVRKRLAGFIPAANAEHWDPESPDNM